MGSMALQHGVAAGEVLGVDGQHGVAAGEVLGVPQVRHRLRVRMGLQLDAAQVGRRVLVRIAVTPGRTGCSVCGSGQGGHEMLQRLR